MEKYVGVKSVNAMPMTREAYNKLRGWEVPADENPADEGYLVEYVGSKTQNHPDYAGYISWSPQAEFEATHRPIDAMTFGQAVEALKQGKSVSRKGWNGKGMFLFMIQGSNDIAKLNGYGFGELLGEPVFRDAIFMKTVDNQLVPWTASQSDVLSEDWELVA